LAFLEGRRRKAGQGFFYIAQEMKVLGSTILDYRGDCHPGEGASSFDWESQSSSLTPSAYFSCLDLLYP
jgi:hypothetical protein